MPQPPAKNLAGLMAAPGSSYEEVLNYARSLDPNIGQPAPAPSPTPQPQQFAAPDPFAQAQALEQRQGAAAQLASPVTPALDTVSLPGEVWQAVLSLLGRGKK